MASNIDFVKQFAPWLTLALGVAMGGRAPNGLVVCLCAHDRVRDY
jgi:hypothetical protein